VPLSLHSSYPGLYEMVKAQKCIAETLAGILTALEPERGLVRNLRRA
jgi:hypothetical protein